MRKFIAKMAVLLAVTVPVVAQAGVIPEKGEIYLKVYRDDVLELTTYIGTTSYTTWTVSKVGCDWNQTVIRSAKSVLDPETDVKTYTSTPYTVPQDSNAIIYECQYYTAHTITVGYDGNGLTGGSTASTAFRYNTAGTIAQNGFTRAFTVNYNGNGGTAGRSSETVNATFNCWADTASGTPTYTYSSGQTAVTNPCDSTGGNVTLYARWNDGSVTLPSASWNGHTFKGWYTDSVGGTRVGGAGDSYGPISKNQALYAQWDINTYTVTCKPGQHGKGDEQKLTKEYGTSLKLPGAIFTREQYTQDGWSRSDGGDKAFDLNASYSDNADATLYPHWKEMTYKITLSDDGHGSARAFPPGSPQLSGTEITITADPNTGYAFEKWISTVEPKTIYQNPYTFTLTQDVQFQANFTNLMCTVTFNPMGGTCSVTNRSVKYGSSIGALPVPTYGVREFKGWFDDSKLETHPITQMTIITSDLTAYAHWGEAQQYTITVKAEPEKGGQVTGGGTYDVKSQVPLTATANTGYSFTQWDDGEKAASREITVTNDVTYTANFEANKYTLFFAGNGGTVPAGKETKTITYDQPYGEMPTPTPGEAGQTFVGWFDAATGGNEVKPSDTVKKTDSVQLLYAHWSTVTYYYVAFDGNGATGGTPMEPQKMDVGKPTALNANTYVREAHNFAGWTNSVGTVYTNCAVVTDIAAPGQTNTLYATWTPWKSYVDFKPGEGGKGTMAQQTFEYGVTNKLTKNDFKKDGFTFQGWTNETKKAFYTDEQKVAFYDPDNTTNTLNAVWTVNTYTMHFEPNAKTVLNPEAQPDISCESGEGVTLPECKYVNLPSCGFLGWVDEAGVTNEAGKIVTKYVSESGTTLTNKAAWQDSGVLSTYVGLAGIAALTNHNVSTVGYMWEESDTEGRGGGKCIQFKADGSPYHCSLTMLVSGPGTLKFRYKTKDVTTYDYFKLYIDTADYTSTPRRYLKACAEYPEVAEKEEIEGNGIHSITWYCDYDGASSGTFYIDDVTWTPEGGKPKPLILFIR